MIRNITQVAIIGAGNMGGALARGLYLSAPSFNLVVSNPSIGKLDALKRECPQVHVTQSNVEAVASADVVILAVKPWKVKDVIEQIKLHLDYSRQAILSVAAGIGVDDLSSMLENGDEPTKPSVYYAIPNTAVAIGEGMIFVSSSHTDVDIDEQVVALLSRVGKVAMVEERVMGAGMAVASCGIAYAMRYIRAAMEGGIELGLYPADARMAVVQTLRGAVALLEANNSHPEQEIDKVTTPGGITIKGLNAMEESGFSASVIKGLRASKS